MLITVKCEESCLIRILKPVAFIVLLALALFPSLDVVIGVLPLSTRLAKSARVMQQNPPYDAIYICVGKSPLTHTLM